MNKVELIVTEDGSHSLYVKELDEHYHSTHGAIQESNHVFIDAGLSFILNNQLFEKPLRILEIGFGTGLNAFLSCIEVEKKSMQVEYTSIEAYPISNATASLLNYSSLVENDKFSPLFTSIHDAEWNKVVQVSFHFSLLKRVIKLDDVEFDDRYDIVFFDAFAPDVQPEMWTEEVFQKLYDSMNSKGCLVTYCAKGVVKRTLKKVGFTVDSIPGPPGKREMVRAIVS